MSWKEIIKAKETEIVHNTPLFMELREEMRSLLSEKPYKRNPRDKERFLEDSNRFFRKLNKNDITPTSEEGKKFLDSETDKDMRTLVGLVKWYSSPQGNPPAA